MTHQRLRDFLSGVFAVSATAGLLCGCGGGPGTPMGSVVGSGGGTQPPPTQLVGVALTVTVPAQHSHHGMAPRYVSPGTQSVSIELASVNGGGVNGVDASVVNTTPKAPNCKVVDGATSCRSKISGARGKDVFTVTTYDGPNATGDVLSVGSASASIGGGGGGLGISDHLSLSIDGLVAGLALSLSPKSSDRGKSLVSRVVLTAFDASGAQIVGSSNFQTPITLSIQGDATGSFALHAGGTSEETVSIAKPAPNITLSYDGDEEASSVTVQGVVADTDPVSASASFTLLGRKPPPPPGTIYVLNLGSNDGQGATVTEYDGTANGDASPIRTLDLDKKLFARGITVDGSGRLYVGYFDSSLGYSPIDGTPDAGNVVAIYAAGASGNAAPVATLAQDSTTQSKLFPLFPVLDASGGLVTYGATTVDGNGGDAVLTYGAGATGNTAPAHGWDFYNPDLYYAGPSGLALDASGNFYMSGALHGTLGPSYGVFVTAASDIGNPRANPSRTIPWDATTALPNGATNVALDSSGEIVVGNPQITFVNSSASCQGRVNIFAAGASGGTTDNKPLRVLTLKGIYTKNSLCASPRSPLQPFYPSVAMYGNTLFAADDFNNAVGAFPSGKAGTIAPALHIAGPATGLNAPIAIFVSSISGHARRGR